MKITIRRRFTLAIMGAAATAALCLAAFVPAAQAQDEVAELEEITVTGSRIVRRGLVSASPVIVVDAAEVTYTGTVRIEDLVQSLPQAFAAQNSTIANGASGTATVSLRHLGSTRTLVLINGRRMMSGDPFTTAPDLNFVPTALVKRVEVLTGGASSVYGSDAVAGVVNFIIDSDFEGLQLKAQQSYYQHDNSNQLTQDINNDRGFPVPTGSIRDGGTLNLSAALGGNFADGRGHATGYVTYRDIDAILKGGRDYTSCTVQTGSTGPRCGGSSTTPWGTFITDNGSYIVDPDTGEFRLRAGEVFNYGPFNHIQRPDTTWSGGTFIDYQLADSVSAYAEIMFMDNYTDAQIAPSGNFYRTESINCDNPLLSPEQVQIICTDNGYALTDNAALYIGRRNVEGGPRTNNIRHTNYRIVSGLRGELNDTWSYDAHGLYGLSIVNESYINDLNVDRIKNALDVITDPATGDPACRVAISGNDTACVPWNIFSNGGVTPEAVDYISTVAVAKGWTKTQVASAAFTGDLSNYDIKLPSADDGVMVVLGAEYREETLDYDPDEVYSKGLRAGSGGRTPPIKGSFNVMEIFTEALVPLVQGARFAEDLSLELAYRYSDYERIGGTHTYKAAVTWAPNDDIRFRSGFNRAVRAPNALEMFRPQGFGLGGDQDICAGPVPTATLAECQNTGVLPAQYGNILANPANQYNTLGGGNPKLTPEVADTFTVGMVLTPAFFDGFSGTIDYYKIEIEDTIGSLGADDIIQTCANTGSAQLCDLIHRDSMGTLWLTRAAYTETTNQNIGKLSAEGIDVTANYGFDIGNAGSIDLSLIGTYMLSDRFSNPLTDYDCVGYFGSQCGQPDAKWRHKARAVWATNWDTSITLAWRMVGKVKIDDASPDPDLGSPGSMDKWITNGIDKIGNESYFDLAATYHFNDDIRATLGINNILDTEPPLAPSQSSTGFSANYDTLGRYMFLGVTYGL